MSDPRKYTAAVRLLASGQSIRVELFPSEQWPDRVGFVPGAYRLRIDGAWLDAGQAAGLMGLPGSDDDGQPYMHFATLDGVARILAVRLASLMGLPAPGQPDETPPHGAMPPRANGWSTSSAAPTPSAWTRWGCRARKISPQPREAAATRVPHARVIPPGRRSPPDSESKQLAGPVFAVRA